MIAISLFVGPVLHKPGIFTYIVLSGSIIYLLAGWYFPLIKEEKMYLRHEIAGFVYSSVMIASVLEQFSFSGARYFTIYGEILALAFAIYMIVKRNEVDRYLLGQSIVLFLLAPIPILAIAISN